MARLTPRHRLFACQGGVARTRRGKLGNLLRLDRRKTGALRPTEVRLRHSVRSRPNKALPKREPLVVSCEVCLDSSEGLLSLDAKLDELVVIPLKFRFKGIASRSGFLLNSVTPSRRLCINSVNSGDEPLLHAISFLLDNVTPRSSSRLNGITPRSSLRIDSVDASSQLLVECVDSATQLSRTSENRSENGEHTGDERHAREYGLKTHLDHPSILTRTTDTTHLFRRIAPC